MPKKLIKKMIFLEENAFKPLMAETNSVKPTIYQALNYSSNSKKSVDIRTLAWKRYGGVMRLTYERPLTEQDITNPYD